LYFINYYLQWCVIDYYVYHNIIYSYSSVVLLLRIAQSAKIEIGCAGQHWESYTIYCNLLTLVHR
jgi:hypothetical protein